MKLSKEDQEKFSLAAEILVKNKAETKHFAERMSGITNGNSERKAKAIAKLLGK